jgi:hypothetical protein
MAKRATGPSTVGERNDYFNPEVRPAGIDVVWVHETLVLDHGRCRIALNEGAAARARPALAPHGNSIAGKILVARRGHLVSRRQTLKAYDRRAKAFKDHAGQGFL